MIGDIRWRGRECPDCESHFEIDDMIRVDVNPWMEGTDWSWELFCKDCAQKRGAR